VVFVPIGQQQQQQQQQPMFTVCGVFEAYLCCKKMSILRVYISEFHSISAAYLVCGQTLCLINGLSQVIQSTNLVGGLEHFSPPAR